MSQEKVIQISQLELRHLRNLPWFTARGMRGDYLLFNVGTLEPGKWGGWHKHEGNEEIYYVMKGSGKFMWEEDGKILEKEIKEGDMVYQPEGLWNQTVGGKEPLVIVFAVAPVSKLLKSTQESETRKKTK